MDLNNTVMETTIIKLAHPNSPSHGVVKEGRKLSEMTLNYWMIVERYSNRTKWLAVRFPAVKLSFYMTETSQVVKHFPCSQKKGGEGGKGRGRRREI